LPAKLHLQRCSVHYFKSLYDYDQRCVELHFKANVCDDDSSQNSDIQPSYAVSNCRRKSAFACIRLYASLMPTGNADAVTLKCSSVLQVMQTWNLRIVGLLEE